MIKKKGGGEVEGGKGRVGDKGTKEGCKEEREEQTEPLFHILKLTLFKNKNKNLFLINKICTFFLSLQTHVEQSKLLGSIKEIEYTILQNQRTIICLAIHVNGQRD